MGSACTAEAARNAAIKSAAAAAGGESRRDDFMVTNYIDGTIRRAARTLRGEGGGESQRSLQHLFFCCRWPLAAGHAPFNLRRHRETTSHLAGSGWSDCTSVWCDDIFLFSLGNPDWIILCSIYVTPLFAWTPWGLTTTLKYTPFGRFSTPVVQPMDGPHTHKYHHRPSQVGISASVRCLSSQNSWTLPL